MRRISLALALSGAVIAAGCSGGSSSSGAGSNPGVKDGTFTVTVQNTAPLTITGGKVTSSPAGIDCGVGATQACTATFQLGTTVVLTGAPTTGNALLYWAGDCSGAGTCTLTGNADKYIVVGFGVPGSGPHPNWTDSTVHGPQYANYLNGVTGALDCTSCHGQTLQGTGIAVACTACHYAKSAATASAKQERCVSCHATSGDQHQALYNSFADGINPATTKFAANIVSVVTTASATAGKFKSTVTFTLSKGGVPFTAAASTLKQKTMYFVSYDATAKKFPTQAYLQGADVDPDGTIGKQNAGDPVNFSYGSMTLADATTGTWTMVKDGLDADPMGAANAFVYGYFGDAVLPIEANTNTSRHYALMDNMVSVAKVLNGTIDYLSTATVSGCEKCHGAPYSKHGYRQAAVSGLNDFVACKACHTDFRRGTDAAWYLLVDDPVKAATGVIDLATKLKYAYTANIMQDTHNSHAMEFAYPQTAANCTICHEGKLDRVITDANFVGTVCKSCHATTNVEDIEKRAPSFAGPVLGPKLAYHVFNWVDGYDASGNLVAPAGTIKHTDSTTGAVTYEACNTCHSVDPVTGTNRVMYGATVPLFKDIHGGFNKAIYAADGSKYSSTIATSAGTASFASNKLTISFNVSNVPADATVKPTLVASLYGYDTKDFVVSGHSSQFSDKTPNLEWSEGAVIRGTTTPANTSRLVVSPATATAGNGAWTVTVDVSTWASKLADGSVKRMELAFLPNMTLADGTAVAIAGKTVTYDFVANAVVENTVGKGTNAIVDAAKCNKCHEALATTFHSPNYGSAGVVGCRLCHFVGTGGSHLEMQSRSIDSYIHAIHAFQKMDIQNVDFADPVQAFEYTEHIDSEYPNFTTLNCESCHTAGSYNVPDQSKSLPGILSASSTIKGKTRAINNVPSVVTGPGSRACGSCHRAALIKEDNAAQLTRFDKHTGPEFGYRETSVAASGTNPSTLDQIIAALKSLFY